MNIDFQYGKRIVGVQFEIPEAAPDQLRQEIFERLNQLLATLQAAGAYADAPPPANAEAAHAPRWNVYPPRDQVRAAIEQASHAAISATDPMPDTLTARAQELGLEPYEFGIWIYDTAQWTATDLTHWATRFGFARCGHCGASAAEDPANHKCKGPDA